MAFLLNGVTMDRHATPLIARTSRGRSDIAGFSTKDQDRYANALEMSRVAIVTVHSGCSGKNLIIACVIGQAVTYTP